jgi:hypothetical protein
MRTTLWLTAGTWVLFAAGAGAVAQDLAPPKPGPEHERLKKLVGTWDATVDMMGTKSKAKAEYRMGPGDLWLLEHFIGDFGGMKFEGMGATGYDPAKKKYVSVWIDSMSPTPMLSEGTLKGDRMVMHSKMNQQGKMVNVTTSSVMKNDNTIFFTMTTRGADGKEMPMMTITYKRKAR